MASRGLPVYIRCDRFVGCLQRHRSATGVGLRSRQVKLFRLCSGTVGSSLHCSAVCSPPAATAASFSTGAASVRPLLNAAPRRPFDVHRLAFSSSRSSSSSPTSPVEPSHTVSEIVVLRLDDGLPVLSVPMPSRPEKCRFILKPLTNTLSDFAAFLKSEDSAIEHVSASTLDGHVIPGLTRVDILLRNDFHLHLNNEHYLVRAPPPVDATLVKEMEDLSGVKDTVGRLFRALSSDQFHLDQQRHIRARLEAVNGELEPLEKVREELHARAMKRTRMLSWVGLGLMGLQFGFLARLTWWEYSWDIMEPVTYFVTYGTAMAMYAYHLLTIQDYAYPDAHDREVVMSMHRFAKKNTFDVSKYNHLRSEKVRLEYDLERLRSPLQIKLSPPYLPSSSTTTSICKAE